MTDFWLGAWYLYEVGGVLLEVGGVLLEDLAYRIKKFAQLLTVIGHALISCEILHVVNLGESRIL